MRKRVRGRYDEVLARLPEALKAEGFGVLTRVDAEAAFGVIVDAIAHFSR
jgi:uncharacterized protein (DUF302 family)